MSEGTTATAGFHLGSAAPGTKIIHIDDMDFSQEREAQGDYQSCSCDGNPHAHGMLMFPTKSPNSNSRSPGYTEIGPPTSCDKCGTVYQLCHNFLDDKVGVSGWCYKCMDEADYMRRKQESTEA